MVIIDKIIALLDEKGLTQKDLTDYLGLEKSSFSSWKAGKSQSYKKYIAEIAKFLDVSSDWLTGNSKYRNEDEVIEYNWGYSDEYFTSAFDFCGLLREIREEQDVSIADMANVIGLDSKQYEECEDGIAPITEQQANKLCEYLGTDVSQVLFDNDLYPEYVPEEYHNNVSGWEKRKAEADAEAPYESPKENFVTTFSQKEVSAIKKYRSLDDYGKDMVDTVLDKEYERCKQTQHKATIPTAIAAQGGGINTEISSESENAVLSKLEELDKNERKNDLGL